MGEEEDRFKEAAAALVSQKKVEPVYIPNIDRLTIDRIASAFTHLKCRLFSRIAIKLIEKNTRVVKIEVLRGNSHDDARCDSAPI